LGAGWTQNEVKPLLCDFPIHFQLIH